MGLWSVWLPTSILLLGVYYLLDRRLYARETPMDRELDRRLAGRLRVAGSRNFLWLLGVVAAVILMHPESPVPIFRFHYCRELTLGLMMLLALATSPRRLWRDNRFTLHPIGEVAALFLGIFATMIPVLVLLRSHGGELGLDHPLEFFWMTGALSSFLDNAPTYLVFFKAAAGAVASGSLPPEALVGVGADRVPHAILVGISLGAVFMGAMTYIGNGPNFMVRAIAHEAGVRMPSFFGYMGWSTLVLLPTFALITLIFLR
jgi:Na+/H+ antiporter NhaD/arsenite permease-like protein